MATSQDVPRLLIEARKLIAAMDPADVPDKWPWRQ